MNNPSENIFQTSDLKKNADKCFIILSKIIQLYHDSNYMIRPGEQGAFLVVNRNKFLSRVRVSLWILAVIELSKLCQKQESFSIPKLLNKMFNDFTNAEWNNKISKEEICNLQKEFETPIIEEKIKNLKTVRDKLYAHLDPEYSNLNDYDGLFFSEDLELLLEVSTKSLKTIYSKVLDTEILIEPYDKLGVKSTIKMLQNV